jgi:hypothetical protein
LTNKFIWLQPPTEEQSRFSKWKRAVEKINFQVRSAAAYTTESKLLILSVPFGVSVPLNRWLAAGSLFENRQGTFD